MLIDFNFNTTSHVSAKLGLGTFIWQKFYEITYIENPWNFNRIFL